MTLFGAWLSARGAAAAREVLARLAESFSDGVPRHYALRVTQVYRRENGAWKVVHRHADEERDPETHP